MDNYLFGTTTEATEGVCILYTDSEGKSCWRFVTRAFAAKEEIRKQPFFAPEPPEDK